MIEAQKPRMDPSAAGTIRLRTPHRPVAPETHPRPVHDARELTAGTAQAEIRLDGMRYVLRITRQGKLILTK
jgi:hemin uptake protein HemP